MAKKVAEIQHNESEPADATRKPFAKKLQELRAIHRVSQREMSGAAGKAQAFAWRWESGAGEPNRAAWCALADFFGVDVRYLLDDSLTEPPASLTDEERRILELARKIGFERAEARLLQIGEPLAESSGRGFPPAPPRLEVKVIAPPIREARGKKRDAN